MDCSVGFFRQFQGGSSFPSLNEMKNINAKSKRAQDETVSLFSRPFFLPFFFSLNFLVAE
jgi:hypothetical protein